MTSKTKSAEKNGFKASDFALIGKLLDDMVVRLGKESEDDASHKEYCEREFAKSADETKSVEETMTQKEAAMSELKDQIATLADEAAELNTEIQALDASVAMASVQRKKENAEFTEMMTLNEAATQLIEKAKNRLNKFYNPVNYVAPPKKELSAEEAIMSKAGFSAAAAFVQIRS